MADSDSGADIAGESDFEDDGGPGFDPSQLTKLTDKQRKKWDKNVRVWRAFMDFLVRHVAIATYKYNCFEAEDLAQFVIAMEKGEAIRSKTKLKKGEEKRVTSFKSMKETSELLAQHQCLVEARRIGNFVDIAGRMRGLGTIAGGFYKSLKKGKVNKLDKIKHYLDYWKGFTVRTFDFSQLAFRNADPRTFNELESKYRVWPTAVRTALHLAQKFLKTASDATGLEVLVRDLRLQQQHMQTAEIVLAARMEDVMRRESGARDSAVTLGETNLFPAACVLHCAKSLQGEALCGSAVYGSWTEMSPTPVEPPPPPPSQTPQPDPPDPPMDSMQHDWWKAREDKEELMTLPMLQGTSHCSCLEHCFLFVLQFCDHKTDLYIYMCVLASW